MLKGLVRFEGISPRVAFKRTESDEMQMLYVNKIVAAQILDGGRARLFAAYEVETPGGRERWLCEVIMEMRDFVVLSYTQVEILGKESATGSYPRIKGKSNTERILFAWNDGPGAEEIAYLPNFMNDGEKMADFSAGWVARLPDFKQDRLLGYMKKREVEVMQYLKKNKIRDVIGGSANPDFRHELFELLKYYQTLEGKMN